MSTVLMFPALLFGFVAPILALPLLILAFGLALSACFKPRGRSVFAWLTLAIVVYVAIASVVIIGAY